MLLKALVAGSLVATLLTQETDRTVPVEAGTRLDLTNFAGEILVTGWDRDEVQVTAHHGSRDHIEIQNHGQVLEIHASSERKTPPIVDYRIQAPKWMPLTLDGPHTDIFVQGMEGGIQASSVEGTIEVRGGSGTVTLRSVEGDVMLRGASGRIEVFNIDGDIHVQECVGQVLAETTDGDVLLQEVELNDVDASTLDGDMLFVGSLAPEGVYRFASHEGDLIVNVQDEPDATFSVAMYEGEFESDFSIQPEGDRAEWEGDHKKKARRFRFTLGSGRAQVELETFEGDIWLRNRKGYRTPRP